MERYYLFSRYTGIVGFGTYTREEVIEHVKSPFWPKFVDNLGWYFIPKSLTFFDGIRPVHRSGSGRAIKTIEDLEYFDRKIAEKKGEIKCRLRIQ